MRVKHIFRKPPTTDKLVFSMDKLMSLIEEEGTLPNLLELLYNEMPEDYDKITVKVYDTKADSKPMCMVFVLRGTVVTGWKIYEQTGEVIVLDEVDYA